MAGVLRTASRDRHNRVRAPRLRVARVGGAHVAVIAVQVIVSVPTGSRTANLVAGASVAIAAFAGIIAVRTAAVLARVEGALVAIFTVRRPTRIGAAASCGVFELVAVWRGVATRRR